MSLISFGSWLTMSCFAFKSKIQPLQAIKAKEATEDLYSAFADKTSISQISNVVIESTRPKIQFVEKTLLQILEALSEQPPVSWLVSCSLFK